MDVNMVYEKKNRSMISSKKKELEKLINIWNGERLVLYHITSPNDNLEYFGIIRIYYQDESKNIISKCFRISSLSNSEQVIAISITKLQINSKEKFILIETHENGEYNKLESTDFPLEVQLGWCEDGREGKFFLCQHKDYIQFLSEQNNLPKKPSTTTILATGAIVHNLKPSTQLLKKDSKWPFVWFMDSAFTRTITNRQKIVERQRRKMINKKLSITKQNINNNSAYSDNDDQVKKLPTIGTIKVFATSLFPDAPYKTIIVSIEDTTECVIKETLEKFALSGMIADPKECYMVLVIITNIANKQSNSHLKSFRRDTREHVVPYNAKPLVIYNEFINKCQTVMFQLRKNLKLTSVLPTNVTEMGEHKKNDNLTQYKSDNIIENNKAKWGYHVVLSLCGSLGENSTITDCPSLIILHKDIAIFGSNKKVMKERIYLGQNPTKLFLLSQGNILPIHCIISTLDNVLTIVPCVMDADVRINNERIYERTILHENSVLTIGLKYCYNVLVYHPHFLSPYSNQHFSSISSFSNKNLTPTNNNIMDLQSIQNTSIKRRNLLDLLTLGQYPPLPLGHKYDFSKVRRVIEICITYVDPKCCDNKLEPSFVIYMTLCSLYEYYDPVYVDKNNICHPNQSYQHFTENVTLIIHELFYIFKKSSDDIVNLVFWLSNTSQLYHFITNDFFLQRTLPTILISTLEDSIREIFRNIIWNFQQELDHILYSLLDNEYIVNLNDHEIDKLIYSDIDINVHDYHCKTSFMLGTLLKVARREPTIYDLFTSLNAWIGLLYYMKLNISFTVQLFQKLFYYCNEWIVNQLCQGWSDKQLGNIIVDMDTSTQSLYNTIENKLSIYRLWAETQGLEEAFDEQFQTTYELLYLLHGIINHSINFENIGNNIKLLSLIQIKGLIKLLLTNSKNDLNLLNALSNQINDNNEYPNGNFTDSSTIIYNNLYISDDDYFSRKNENITICIRTFLQPLVIEGISVLVINNDPGSHWENRFERILKNSNTNSIMHNTDITTAVTDSNFVPIANNSYDCENPDNQCVIYINKPPEESLGMHIVSVQNNGSKRCAIYIKSIVKGLLADKSKMFHVGDQILSINDETLDGLGVDEVVKKIKQHEPYLQFKIFKLSAQGQGVIKLISDVNDDNLSQQTNYSSNATDSSEIFSFPEPPNETFDDNIENDNSNNILPICNLNGPIVAESHNPLFYENDIGNKIYNEINDDGWVSVETTINDPITNGSHSTM